CVLAHARNNTLPLARVGARPAARRVCGGSRAPWAIGLERDAESGALLSVWGPSPSQVYAVGGNPESGAMVRFDGERWVDDALPDDFPLTDWIYDVADPSGQPGVVLWVAGSHGQTARRELDG